VCSSFSCTGRDINGSHNRTTRYGRRLGRTDDAHSGTDYSTFITESPIFLDNFQSNRRDQRLSIVQRCFNSIYTNRITLPLAPRLYRHQYDIYGTSHDHGRPEDQARLIAASTRGYSPGGRKTKEFASRNLMTMRNELVRPDSYFTSNNESGRIPHGSGR